MSVRMLQRTLKSQNTLLSQQQQQQHNHNHHHLPHESEDEEEEEGGAVAAAGVAKNPFDLLVMQDDDLDGKQEEEEEPDSDLQSTAVTDRCSRQASASSKSKKNKGKKKVKPSVASEAHSKDDSIDLLLERLTLDNPEASSSEVLHQDDLKPSRDRNDVMSVLAINPKHLRAEDELRRIFGAKVINEVERGNNGAAARYRRQGAPRHVGRIRPLKKTILVIPMETWPRWDGGISMDNLESKDGLIYFRYVYSSSYMEIQKEYEACVESHDPNSILSLLFYHPYHIDSLLALSELFKHMGNYQQSALLLEQCLYALENAWHPSFSPTAGNCRLKYSCDSNKPFFFALLRHMQHVGRRGCHRTALEICKLLLSLDSDDPLGALLCIDYYALRAEEYAWLESFVDRYGKDEQINLLPNFSFSVAVARFYMEQQSSGGSITEMRRSDPLCLDGTCEDGVTSSDLLRQALMLHPLCLKRIVQKAPIKEDVVWTQILSHPHFAVATTGGPSLEHLINIYIERHHLIWRAPDLQSWLKAAALAVVEAADKLENYGEIENWACVRKEAFTQNQNKYQHLIAADFNDSNSTLPPEFDQVGFQGHNVVEGDAVGGNGENEFPPDIDLEGHDAIMAFLQSVLPWRDFAIDPLNGNASHEGNDFEDDHLL